MIACPKCKADNMIGAIFCRGCGEKLNIDELRPEDIEKAAPKEKKGPGLIRNLVALVILAAVGTVLVMLFLQPPFAETASVDGDALKHAKGQVLLLITPKTPARTQVSMSRAEAITLARRQLGLTTEQLAENAQKAVEAGTSMNLTAQDIDVEFLSATQAKFILRSRFMNKMNVYTTLICDVSAASEGGVKFAPVQAYMGRMPLYFGPLIDKCVERFTLLTNGNEDLKTLDKNIGTISLDGDKVTLTKK